MSAPIILADGLYHALFHAKDMVGVSTALFIAAIVTAAVVGGLSIKFLLNYLKTKGFGIFAVYRFVFGAFIIVLILIRK